MLRIGDLDAEPFQESVVAEIIDRRLVGGEIERRDLGGLHAIGAERGLGPLSDELTGLEIIGREGRIGRVDRIERCIQHDDEQTGVARLLDRRHDGARIRWDQHESLGTSGDQIFDGLNLSVVVAVDLARIGLQRDAEFLRLGLGAFLHLDEERVDVGLRDQADDFLVGRKARRREHGQNAAGEHEFLQHWVSSLIIEFDVVRSISSPHENCCL